MHISFSPIRSDATLTVFREGEKLTINGVELDFSSLPEGATLPADAISSDWISGDVSRQDGQLHICLLLPHGAAPSEHVAFPQAVIDPADGQIAIPHDNEQDESAHDHT